MLTDLRLALRRVWGAPRFSVGVVLILALGFGATASISAVLNALVFRTLPLPNPQSLVAVASMARGFQRTTPLPALEHLRKKDLAATGWCAYSSAIDAVESGGRVLQSNGELLAGDCETVIGVRPQIGRWFTASESPTSGPGAPVIVITDRYWKRMFDGAPDVVGRTVRIQNITATIIGVMPADYSGFSTDLASDFIIPFNSHRASSGALLFLGRLRDGMTVEQLRSQVSTFWPELLDTVLQPGPTRAQTLADTTGDAQLFQGGQSTLRRLYAPVLGRLTAISIALLVLVCVNIGGLLISRVTRRLREISTMSALGASTLRIIRPLMFEVLVLSLGGFALGMPLAYAASTSFGLLLPQGNLPWSLDTTLDTRVVISFGVGIVALAGVIAAVPSWLAGRYATNVNNRTMTAQTNIWPQTLLVAQVALAVVLVFGCGLIVRSFSNLQNVDRGFRKDHLLSVRLAANPGGYRDMDAATYYPSLLERLQEVPGVTSVGMARYFGTINSSLPDQPVGFFGTSDSSAAGAMDFVSPNFFHTIGAPLLKGRDFAWTDSPTTDRVAVVSDSLARALAPDGDVVGKVVRYGTNPAYAKLTIVGVVGNISIGNLRQTAPRMIYTSSVQSSETTFSSVHLRTEPSPMGLATAVTDTITGMGREHPLGIYPDMLFGNSVVAERMGAVISAVAATIALIISSIGLFALLGDSVERRRREIGVRVALGASRLAISNLILREGMRLVGIGLVVGLPIAVAATPVIKSLLYDLGATDTVTVVGSLSMVVLFAAVALIRPTVSALRVDPSSALRSE